MLANFTAFLITIALVLAMLGLWWSAAIVGGIALAIMLGVWLLTEAGWLSPEFGK